MKIQPMSITDTSVLELFSEHDDFMTEFLGEDSHYYTRYTEYENIENVWVAYEDELPVGCIAYRKKTDNVGEVKRLFIRKEYRGRGISKELLKVVETHARNLGCTALFLDTRITLEPAVSLYRSFGFDIIFRQGLYIQMEKKLMIETERLILRPFIKTDAQDLYEYLKEPLVNCFACMKISSLEEAKKEAVKRGGDGEFTFAIVLKETGKVIGEIDAHPETSQPDGTEHMALDTFSPCWMLNKDYQGKGYAYEAARAFFDYLFMKKGARRIYAYTEDYNLSGQHLCEKLGMRREGMFMEFVSFVKNTDGTPLYENTIQYAILKKEWERG